MPGTATLDLQVPRNGDYFAEWQLQDNDGDPIDLTGHALTMNARAVAGDAAVLASATLAMVEPLTGRFTVRWHGVDFDGFGNVFSLARASYDLKHLFPDGIVEIPVRGQLLIVPEVTA